MCGITGVFNYYCDDKINRKELELATNSMKVRGSDDVGF